MNRTQSLILLVLLVGISGCAKGAMWRLGYLSPRVREQWAEEEQYAKTWQSLKPEMTALVENSNLGSPSEQQRAAGQLAAFIKDDKRILVRLHATELLAKLPGETAHAAVLTALKDGEADVRIAACRVLASHNSADSMLTLQRTLGSDTNPDVRLAAARSLGQFDSPAAAKSLQVALNSDEPALQLCAADSLQKITGKKFGRDIPQWQEYIATMEVPGGDSLFNQVALEQSEDDKYKLKNPLLR